MSGSRPRPPSRRECGLRLGESALAVRDSSIGVQALALKRHNVHLTYTAPTEGDPESGWMIEVFDDAGHLRGIAVGKTAEDALTTVLEDLLPDEGA
jgi:hypothetical protein